MKILRIDTQVPRKQLHDISALVAVSNRQRIPAEKQTRLSCDLGHTRAVVEPHRHMRNWTEMLAAKRFLRLEGDRLAVMRHYSDALLIEQGHTRLLVARVHVSGPAPVQTPFDLMCMARRRSILVLLC